MKTPTPTVKRALALPKIVAIVESGISIPRSTARQARLQLLVVRV
jgi:hypothetical protein